MTEELVPFAEIRKLATNGWSSKTTDLCWMACPRPGHRKIDGEWEIFLCWQHAHEHDAQRDGSHALLLQELAASEWPWRLRDYSVTSTPSQPVPHAGRIA